MKMRDPCIITYRLFRLSRIAFEECFVSRTERQLPQLIQRPGFSAIRPLPFKVLNVLTRAFLPAPSLHHYSRVSYAR